MVRPHLEYENVEKVQRQATYQAAPQVEKSPIFGPVKSSITTIFGISPENAGRGAGIQKNEWHRQSKSWYLQYE